MKHRLLVCTALCMATGLAQAQYKMDLSDVTYPKIEYLKMVCEKTPNENLPNDTWDSVE